MARVSEFAGFEKNVSDSMNHGCGSVDGINECKVGDHEQYSKGRLRGMVR